MAANGTIDVALVGSYPPPHGGQSVHILNLSKHLRARGMDVTVFNTGSNKAVRETGVVNISSARSLLTALLLGSRFKLVHVHVSSAQDYGKLLPVRLAATVKRIPWLATIHSGSSVKQMRGTSLLRRRMARAVLGAAQAIICVNDAIRKELATLVAPDAVVVIPPFSLEFSAAPLSTEVNAFVANHSPIISCVGLYEPAYGFDQAVPLMARIREVYPHAGLLLIGDLKNADWCRSLIGQLRLKDHVKLCGNLGHEECLSVMSRSALFLRPTRYDGDSISVREALALGVKVVASKTDFRPDGVVLYRVGVFEDLVAKTLECLGSSGKAATASGGDHLNLEQVRELYLSAMNRHLKN